MSADLRVRPLAEADIPALDDLGHRAPGLWAHRLDEQSRYISLTLVASIGPNPIGHAVLTWEGPRGTPDISDVWVVPSHRRQGVARFLIESCESVARDQGMTRVGLSVGVENHAAQALYSSLGYLETPDPPFEESGEWTDAGGIVRAWSEWVRYRVKSL